MHEPLADGARGPWLSPTAPRPPIGDELWRTGGAIDEFIPIYLALARETDRHGHIGTLEADAMDLSVIAALMGVGEHERMQADAWGAMAVMPTVPMVRKVRPE